MRGRSRRRRTDAAIASGNVTVRRGHDDDDDNDYVPPRGACPGAPKKSRGDFFSTDKDHLISPLRRRTRKLVFADERGEPLERVRVFDCEYLYA